MITSKELREGNLLEYFIGEEGCEWDTATVDWQDIKWCSEEQDHFNQVHRPIPLTEVWLRKCAEDRSTKDMHLFYISLKSFRLVIGGLKKNQNFTLFEMWGLDENGDYDQRIIISLRPMMFLHQLQNFLLEHGEELTLNK